MKGDGIGRKPNQNRNQKGEGKSHVKIFQFQNKKRASWWWPAGARLSRSTRLPLFFPSSSFFYLFLIFQLLHVGYYLFTLGRLPSSHLSQSEHTKNNKKTMVWKRTENIFLKKLPNQKKKKSEEDLLPLRRIAPYTLWQPYETNP